MSRQALSITFYYTLFAVISIAINIGTQMFSMQVYSGLYAVEVSIVMGTATGLPLRYFLEKRYIFNFKSKNVVHDGQLFVLYGFLGVFTTAIFWGTEYLFHLIFDNDTMRYLGGLVGLVIGFCVKYQLDKKFVFVNVDQAELLWPLRR